MNFVCDFLSCVRANGGSVEPTSCGQFMCLKLLTRDGLISILKHLVGFFGT